MSFLLCCLHWLRTIEFHHSIVGLVGGGGFEVMVSVARSNRGWSVVDGMANSSLFILIDRDLRSLHEQ